MPFRSASRSCRRENQRFCSASSWSRISVDCWTSSRYSVMASTMRLTSVSLSTLDSLLLVLRWPPWGPDSCCPPLPYLSVAPEPSSRVPQLTPWIFDLLVRTTGRSDTETGRYTHDALSSRRSPHH